MAFTRSPETGAPATYTGTDAVDTLILADQASDITISGLAGDDGIVLSAAALAANALSGYKVYGNDGDDTISITAAQLSSSTVQGGGGDDIITSTAGANVLGSVVRGGAADDTLFVRSLNQSTVNGNKGTDTITVTGNAFSSRVYGGSENDTINIGNGVGATLTGGAGTRFNGSKGADTLAATAAANLTGASLFGGEGGDNITVAATNASTLYLSGDKGSDIITATGVTVGGEVFGGEGNDFITVGGAAAGDAFDIDAGVGADTITLVGGATGTDTITFSRGDSVAATTSNFAVATAGSIDNTDTITFGSGVDTITNFVTGTDVVDIDIAVPGALTAVAAADSTTTNTLAPTAILELRGGLAGNVFTVDLAAGADYLYVVGGGNATYGSVLNNSTNAFVSVGAQLAITDFD